MIPVEIHKPLPPRSMDRCEVNLIEEMNCQPALNLESATNGCPNLVGRCHPGDREILRNLDVHVKMEETSPRISLGG